jgi:hypothetical protein
MIREDEHGGAHRVYAAAVKVHTVNGICLTARVTYSFETIPLALHKTAVL